MTRKPKAKPARRKVWAIYQDGKLHCIEHLQGNARMWRDHAAISEGDYRIVPGTFIPSQPKPRRRK